MQQLKFLFLTWLSKGSENQSFLGARWVAWFLRILPQSLRRPTALRLLAWSPHYFYRDLDDKYDRLTYKQFLEAEYRRNRDSRLKIRDQILAPFLASAETVIDYGCGPGFLAASVAELGKDVTAVDISHGVLACANIINKRSNLSYIHHSSLNALRSESIDLVYSFAVIQHVTDEVLANILRETQRLLKPDGKLVLHIVLEETGWRSQADWEADRTLRGRVKLNYGLNCFSRTEAMFHDALSASGFEKVKIQAIQGLCSEHFDDICGQHLLTANIPSVAN